ncbi:MAG TPA: rhodanese-like domain-containing protein [Clostridia bacterium]|nr:rhodanese-like domain-containing protein [Clostridia bacterium]
MNPQIVSFTPREVFEYINAGAIIVDIRPAYETDLRVFDVPRVIYLSGDSNNEIIDNLPRNNLLIVADSVGNQSKEFALSLVEHGYSEVACLAGGVVAWDHAGLPLAKDLDYEMIGGCACRLQPQKIRMEGSSVSPK